MLFYIPEENVIINTDDISTVSDSTTACTPSGIPVKTIDNSKLTKSVISFKNGNTLFSRKSVGELWKAINNVI